jgi:hypothetical protein
MQQRVSLHPASHIGKGFPGHQWPPAGLLTAILCSTHGPLTKGKLMEADAVGALHLKDLFCETAIMSQTE